MIEQPISSPRLLSLLFQGVEAQLADICRAGSEATAQLERMPVPIYVTDAEGAVLAWNGAAADFAGRTPTVEDRWCVTWKLRAVNGTPLAHEDCPMAQALKSGAPVRGAVALAERPDGGTVPFTPFPTPMTDDEGRVIGGFNLLLDVSDGIAAVERLLSFTEELRRPEIEWAAA